MNACNAANELRDLMHSGERFDSSDPDNRLLMALLESHDHYAVGRYTFGRRDDGWIIYLDNKALPWGIWVKLGLPGYHIEYYSTLWEAVTVTQSPRFNELIDEILAEAAQTQDAGRRSPGQDGGQS